MQTSTLGERNRLFPWRCGRDTQYLSYQELPALLTLPSAACIYILGYSDTMTLRHASCSILYVWSGIFRSSDVVVFTMKYTYMLCVIIHSSEVAAAFTVHITGNPFPWPCGLLQHARCIWFEVWHIPCNSVRTRVRIPYMSSSIWSLIWIKINKHSL